MYRKIIFSISLILIIVSCGTTKTNFNDNNYEIICQNLGSEGTYLVKVYTYGNNEKRSLEQAKHRAIHGIMFKGLYGSNCESIPKICNVTYESKKQAFDNFFSTGKYLDYVVLSNDYTTNDRINTDHGVKLGFIVSIRFKDLRNYLETQGLVISMNSIYE